MKKTVVQKFICGLYSRKRDAYKQSLKDEARRLGLKTSGSIKEIEKRISKSYKSEKEAKKALENLQLQKARKDLEGTEKTDKESLYKQQLLESVYTGKISRENAKELYKVAYPGKNENWIYQSAPDFYTVGGGAVSSKGSNIVTAPDGTLIEITD